MLQNKIRGELFVYYKENNSILIIYSVMVVVLCVMFFTFASRNYSYLINRAQEENKRITEHLRRIIILQQKEDLAFINKVSPLSIYQLHIPLYLHPEQILVSFVCLK